MTTTPGSSEPPRPDVPTATTVTDLAAAIEASLEGPAASTDIRGITLDSRSVLPGDLWCALPGAHAHGADFATQAAQNGAVAALTDAEGAARCIVAGLPVLVSPDPRAVTAHAAALVQGRPAQSLATVGVTGTNGKTSVTTMLHAALRSLGRSSGIIGTSGTQFVDAAGRERAIATVRTTPEAPEVHGILARMVEAGVQVCSMEVSSHALVLHRADEIVFDAACFTNLSQDHLDFHGDMEHYFRAKALLFTPEHSRQGIVCVDDDWGRRLAVESGVPVTTYTTRADREADLRVHDIRPEGFGSTFTLDRDGTRTGMRSPLPGRHYVANAVAVLLLLEALGVPTAQAQEAIARESVIPGRMELVADAPVRGVVDFSHTPDALVQALTTLRSLPGGGRIIAVIGAGGDRDPGKRPAMGDVAARLADVVIVTDDNPRDEDPAAIRDQIISGIPAASPASIEEVPGREAAIHRAAEIADVGDTILVAGKGAETGQVVRGIVHPFDDRAILRDALAVEGHRMRTEDEGC